MTDARVLVVGVGSGRSIPILLASDASVDALEEDPGRAAAVARRFANDARVRVARTSYRDPSPLGGDYAAALSTHALLHGSIPAIAAAVESIRTQLRIGGVLAATFGSKADPRHGAGTSVGPDTYAARDGSEAGVPHGFFDARGVRAILAGFAIDDLRETGSGDAVGRWAHDPRDAERIVHWWVRARRV